jgi:hypothetical protein
LRRTIHIELSSLLIAYSLSIAFLDLFHSGKEIMLLVVCLIVGVLIVRVNLVWRLGIIGVLILLWLLLDLIF